MRYNLLTMGVVSEWSAATLTIVDVMQIKATMLSKQTVESRRGVLPQEVTTAFIVIVIVNVVGVVVIVVVGVIQAILGPFTVSGQNGF